MTLEHQIARLKEFEKFSEENRANSSGFILGNHQLIPLFDAVENGLRRFILAYGTGGGKTAVPIEIIKHLKKRKESQKVLVIAPRQTLAENWNEDLLIKHNCPGTLFHMTDNLNKSIPEKADFVTINYHKLNKAFSYLDEILKYASQASLVVADELHNAKDRNGKISRGYQQVIEASRDARFIGLTATPCPDVLSDAGMMLFALDPNRYAHYKEIAFDVNEDAAALWEMRERGQIRFFDKEAVARFHGLPKFEEKEPLNVIMSPHYVDKYLEAYKQTFHLGKIHNLERIAIEAMINSEDTKDFLRDKISKKWSLNFFSHLMHEPKKGTPDEAIFRQLEKVLRDCGAMRVEHIMGRGETRKDEVRREIQKAMADGKVDALINQWLCTSEGFSEVAGYRPVCIIPLISPFAPGRAIQMIGRSHRPGQRAEVEYQELHAHSEKLIKDIENFVYEYAEQKNLRIKTSWDPSLIHRSIYLMRNGKEQETNILLTQRSHGLFHKKESEANSMMEYVSLLSSKRSLDISNREKSDFGSGIRRAIKYVGKPYEEGLKSDIDDLARDYDRNNILLYAPGKINLFLAEQIEKLKEEESAKEKSWKIADLGCCTSAPLCQARLVIQHLNSLEKKVGFDKVTNVDGHARAVRNARRLLENKKWLTALSKLKIPGYSENNIARISDRLKDQDFMKSLDFRVANFASDSFGSNYDLIVTSQCLQYNDQENNRDVEKIVANVNHLLRENGHYLIVLTGNDRKKSFTRPEDVESCKEILSHYGFDIARYEHLSGYADGKEVLKPFHYIQAIKRRQAPEELVNIEFVPIMYSNTIEFLTGGFKEKRFLRTPPKTEAGPTSMPDVYIGEDGKPINL